MNHRLGQRIVPRQPHEPTTGLAAGLLLETAHSTICPSCGCNQEGCCLSACCILEHPSGQPSAIFLLC